MSCEATTTEILHKRGLRATWQRQLIACELQHAAGHRSAQQILDGIQQLQPALNASTVYRTLAAFRELGLVSETNLGTGELSYAWLGDERHHHLICRECQQTLELSHEYLAELRAAILDDHGFDATVDHFAIFGLCRECRAAAHA